jgi:hypothetical protein
VWNGLPRHRGRPQEQQITLQEKASASVVQLVAYFSGLGPTSGQLVVGGAPCYSLVQFLPLFTVRHQTLVFLFVWPPVDLNQNCFRAGLGAETENPDRSTSSEGQLLSRSFGAQARKKLTARLGFGGKLHFQIHTF